MKWHVALTAALLALPVAAHAQPPAENRPAAEQKRRPPMFANVSPEGRKLLGEAMRANSREHRQALDDARNRVNRLVAAEKLDVPALRQAMEAERRLVDASHARRQAALLAALQKMSVEDRKTFAAEATRGRESVNARTSEWRKRTDEILRQMRGNRPPRD